MNARTDTETRRRVMETRGRGDAETRRRSGVKRQQATFVHTSPRLRVSASPRRFVPASPCPRVSASLELLLALACVFGMVSLAASAQTKLPRTASVAVLDFGETETGTRAAERVWAGLVAGARGVKAETTLVLVDRALSRDAARGVGYAGSLNLTLRDARDLGAAIGSDFFVTGDAQTIRRSSSAAAVYFEAYASVFIVSARTGRLVMWDRPSSEAATPKEATEALLVEVDRRARTRYAAAILEAQTSEAQERRAQLEDAGETIPVADLSGDESTTEQSNLRTPQPFRRLRPAYTDTAARAEVEATVDVLVEIDADGEVRRTEIARWAGFGLDESVVSTVRQMHFRPALRDGAPVPARFLLRYNFRRPKPAQQAQDERHE